MDIDILKSVTAILWAGIDDRNLHEGIFEMAAAGAAILFDIDEMPSMVIIML